MYRRIIYGRFQIVTTASNRPLADLGNIENYRADLGLKAVIDQHQQHQKLYVEVAAGSLG